MSESEKRCTECGHGDWEMRGNVRRYITLDAELAEETWTDGDDCTYDVNDEGAVIVYCAFCGHETTEAELRGESPAPRDDDPNYDHDVAAMDAEREVSA